MKQSVTNMHMYTSPRAKQILLHDGPQTAANILPIVLCQSVHEAHHSKGMYNPWVRPNIKNLLLFYVSFSLDAGVFKPHLSLGNRDPLNNPFLYVVYSKHMADVFALQLKGSEELCTLSSIQLNALTCTLTHCLSSVLKYWACLQAANKVSVVHQVISWDPQRSPARHCN